MKIGLIHPRGNFVAQNPHMREFVREASEVFRPWMIPNLGLLTVAGLTPPGVEMEYIDENAGPVDLDAPFDLVGLSGMTQQAPRAYELARAFGERGVHTVMGGPHATVASGEVARHVDTVVAGESEGVWEQFLEDFRRGRPRQRYANLDLKRVPLEDSPQPRYDLIGKEFFGKGGGYKMIPVQTTRGCPRRCDFCSVPQISGNDFRTKSVAQVIRDAQAAAEAAPGTMLVFSDDNMFINRKFSRELLAALEPMGLRYMAQSDIGIADDPAFLRQIRESGCVMCLVGLESLSLNTLKTIDAFKARRRGGYEDGIRRIQEEGISVLAAFIVGFDDDTEETFDRIADFIWRTRAFPQVTIATPLPKTRLMDRLLEEGRLPGEPFWERCTYYDAVFEPRGLTTDQLERGIADLH
ncbi:MAG: radical SAM protein, partial [Nitrospinota bacterium]|nr:radical SAM protein [Nitrospinota bacterium]